MINVKWDQIPDFFEKSGILLSKNTLFAAFIARDQLEHNFMSKKLHYLRFHIPALSHRLGAATLFKLAEERGN